MSHAVLIGDSISTTAPYISGRPDVVRQTPHGPAVRLACVAARRRWQRHRQRPRPTPRRPRRRDAPRHQRRRHDALAAQDILTRRRGAWPTPCRPSPPRRDWIHINYGRNARRGAGHGGRPSWSARSTTRSPACGARRGRDCPLFNDVITRNASGPGCRCSTLRRVCREERRLLRFVAHRAAGARRRTHRLGAGRAADRARLHPARMYGLSRCRNDRSTGTFLISMRPLPGERSPVRARVFTPLA